MSNLKFKHPKAVTYPAIAALVAIGVLGGGLVSLNVQPYVSGYATLFEAIQAQSAMQAGLLDWIPLVGPRLTQFFATSGTMFFGTVTFAAIQIAECLPLIMSHSREDLQNNIEGLEGDRSRYEERDTDSGILRQFKREYNTIPEKAVQFFLTAKWVAYAIDVALLLWHYPIQGAYGGIDLPQLAINLAILFMFEICLLVALNLLNYIIYFSKRQRQKLT